MGKVGAFLQVERKGHDVRPAQETIEDYDEFALPLTLEEQGEQASRCMNCGVAFCQSGASLAGSRQAVGCPLHNLIPETNDLLYRKRYDDAVARLSLTNPFPEFTGRVCPAPCEVACNLGLNKEAVTINDNERSLSDYAWEHDFMQPLPQASPDAPTVSIIGSGPAGLTAAWEMARNGWKVRVYERDERPGGLLMYGIPNMKLPKEIIDRRINLMKDSSIEFICNADVQTQAQDILDTSDAVIIATGANIARDVELEGRELDGIYFALDYLHEVTDALLEDHDASINAQGKDVVVLGGGDTGTDCVACAVRQGAKSVTQVIRAPRPADEVNTQEVWPQKRDVYSQAYGQREAEATYGEDPRKFSTDTLAFIGTNEVEGVKIQSISYEGEKHLVEGTEETIPAQLVLIAKGFTGTDTAIFEAFNVAQSTQDGSDHLLQATDVNQTPVYIAGDALGGASLVVNAMADALDCVEEILEA